MKRNALCPRSVRFAALLAILGAQCAQAAQRLPTADPASEVPVLISRLGDADARARTAAAKALSELGPKAKDAVPALTTALRDKSEIVRPWAAKALGRIGPAAKGAVRGLAHALSDTNRWTRLQAAWALGEIGPEAVAAHVALARLLRDRDRDVRHHAAWALGKIGTPARNALPALLKAYGGPDEEMRRAARSAVKRVSAWVWTDKEKQQIAELLRRVKESDGIFRLESRHWVVETEVSANFTAEVAVYMDVFVEAVTRIPMFKAWILIDKKPKVSVLASREAFRRVTKSSGRGNCRYRKDDDGKLVEFGVCTFVEKPEERDFLGFPHKVLQHEGAHILLQRMVGWRGIPRWLNEGMATYFAFWDLRASAFMNKTLRRVRSSRVATLRKHMDSSNGKLPDLGSLIRIDSAREWNPDDMGPATSLNYAMAESFMDFLLSSIAGNQAFRRIYAGLIGGAKLKELLSDREVSRLEPLWQHHVRMMLGN